MFALPIHGPAALTVNSSCPNEMVLCRLSRFRSWENSCSQLDFLVWAAGFFNYQNEFNDSLK